VGCRRRAPCRRLGGFRFKLYRDFSNDPAMQCSLDGFLAHWPLFWQRIQIADRPAYIAATLTGGHATHKHCQPAARLPESGMAVFAAG
jgi:hypothetical protein